MSDLQPWHRQPGETVKAFAAFERYLSLGFDRTVINAYRQHSGILTASKSAGYWGKWASENRWEERAAAYEDHLAKARAEQNTRAEQEAHLEKLEQFRKAHEQVGIAGFDIALRATKLLSEFLKKQPAIQTLDEARKLVNLVDPFLRHAPPIWEQALGIPQLKELAQEMMESKE